MLQKNKQKNSLQNQITQVVHFVLFSILHYCFKTDAELSKMLLQLRLPGLPLDDDDGVCRGGNQP